MQAEYDAFVERLRTHPRLQNKVHDTVRTTDAGALIRENYVVAFPAIPDALGDDRYTAPQRYESRRFLSFDVRVVATTGSGMLALVGDVMKHMITHTLTVEDRECTPITMATDAVEEGTGQYDRTARLYFLDLSLEFYSSPKEA